MAKSPAFEAHPRTDATSAPVCFDAGQAHEQYTTLGYDAIPLKPLSKHPLSNGWQSREPFQQWHNAPKNSNIGLRAGHGKAFIDCDDKNQPGTFSNVINWLEGLGYRRGEIPIVQTASGIGRHVYVNFTGSLFGSRKNFVGSIGAGDFRYGSGSFVAAYPSVVGDSQYKLLQGDLGSLPALDRRDIETLIGTISQEVQPQPIPQMSALARALANGNLDLLKDRYNNDKSDAEAALVLSLINSGFDFPHIKHIFDTNPCAGHYREKYKSEKTRSDYLLRTYREMLTYSQHESPTRRTIQKLQDLAEHAAWNKPTDKLVFIAHTKIAYKVGRLAYAASRRDLALEAGLNDRTATHATTRLLTNEMLALEEKSAARFANRYALQVDKITHFLTSEFLGSGEKCPLPQQVADPECGLILDLKDIETADAFRNGKGKLGRRAGQVYKLLFTESLTNSEIARRTGASSKTIQRILKKLSAVKDYKTGEVLEMVSRGEGGHWHSNVVDLELLEAIYGTRGARAKQRSNYERERRDHARSLELGQVSKG
jgi:bifunctional DNA primase/polymerase-like protein